MIGLIFFVVVVAFISNCLTAYGLRKLEKRIEALERKNADEYFRVW